jgi:hypothetical protein
LARGFALLLGSCIALASISGQARAGRANFLGAWTITRASIAPWATRAEAADLTEPTRLVRRTVVFEPDRIAGPAPLACRHPRYRVRTSGPDRLFEGSLTRPVVQARALGFQQRAIATLETGCAGGIEFHFRDRRTALFGLNDVIYILRRHPVRSGLR